MAAGKAAAARLRQAGRAGEEEEDLEDSATAFEDDLAEGESSAPLAAVSAVLCTAGAGSSCGGALQG